MDYRAQVIDESNASTVALKATKDVTTFKDIEIKKHIYDLKEMITDVDHLFKIDNIRAMLPKDFPHNRNPFMLGKTVDELANIVPPHAEPGIPSVPFNLHLSIMI